MRVIAIDPGTVTGVCICEHNKQTNVLNVTLDEIPDGVVGYAKWAMDLDYDYGVYYKYLDYTHVCESFIISPRTLKTARVHDSLDIIGYIKGVIGFHDEEPVMQTPAQAKQFATDDKLRRLGLYTATKDGHANDAARHFLTYMARHESDLFAQMWKESLPCRVG